MENERILEKDSKFINRCKTDGQKSAVLTIEKIWSQCHQGNISPDQRSKLIDKYLNDLSPRVQNFLFNETNSPNNKPTNLIREIAAKYSQFPRVRR